MPNFYNPYGNVITPYPSYIPNYYGQSSLPNSQPNSYSGSTMVNGNMTQVDGEIGAKSFTPPVGSSGPFAMWDMNDNVVYVRMFNVAGPMGPLKKFRLTEEDIGHNLYSGQSGESQIDTSQFVTKSDFNDLKQELRQLIEEHNTASQVINRQQNNQNGSNNAGRQR